MPQPCDSGSPKEAPHYRVEMLEAEDEVDWWSRAASAAASMSTSLRERGTFSALRSRLSSSRPFRLSDRPSRTSALELEEGGDEDLASQGPHPLSPHKATLSKMGKGAKQPEDSELGVIGERAPPPKEEGP